MSSYPSIRERGFSLLVNAVIAYAVFVWGSGQLIPSGGMESAWLVCALSYWFLALLSAPWFVPPRDVIISGIGALLVLTTMEFTDNSNFVTELLQIRSGAVAYSALVVFFAVVALFLHDKDERSPAGHFSYKVASIFGRGELLFSAPAVISIVAAYQSSFATMAWLLLYWLLVTIGKPVEHLLATFRQLSKDRLSVDKQPTIGSIARIDHPNIVRVRLSVANEWLPNRLFTAKMPDGSQQFIVSLFSQIQGLEVVGTGLCVATAHESIAIPNGAVCSSHDDDQTKDFLEKLSGARDVQLAGFVIENSNIGVVAFEVAANSNLNEGDVVFVRLDGEDVFYQIIGAETFEESFDKNPRGTHVVRAAQLGIYSPQNGFSKYAWLPSMNTPVFSAGSRDFEKAVAKQREFPIGKVPSADVEVIAGVDELVEYHTAILGVTGTGKTELALDIVKESVSNGVKVFCVDFTGDYKHRLSDLNPLFPGPSSKQASDLENKLFAVETGEYGAKQEKKALKEGIDELREDVAKQIDEFLRSNENNLAIFELGEITNTKASLRLTELYLSTIMDWARNHRRARKVFIALEEAHTIVPEVFGSGFDADTQFVVSRIGQIALQGRKYGVGLLVISQRTALVSKTILSQCNTFLTHSLIDQTSLNFLDSVYSSEHTRLIPNLGKFEFLAFGKAIKAERPVILRREFDQSKLDASLALHQPLQGEGEDEVEQKIATEDSAAAPDATSEPRITQM